MKMHTLHALHYEQQGHIQTWKQKSAYCDYSPSNLQYKTLDPFQERNLLPKIKRIVEYRRGNIGKSRESQEKIPIKQHQLAPL